MLDWRSSFRQHEGDLHFPKHSGMPSFQSVKGNSKAQQSTPNLRIHFTKGSADTGECRKDSLTRSLKTTTLETIPLSEAISHEWKFPPQPDIGLLHRPAQLLICQGQRSPTSHKW